MLRQASTIAQCHQSSLLENTIHRGSYISAHVLLNLLNELRKRDKMRGLPNNLSLYRNNFDNFNNTSFYFYHVTLRLL